MRQRPAPASISHNARAAFILVSSLAALAAGCGEPTSRYAIVAPATSRGPIAMNAGELVSRDKIDYELFQAEDKVVVRFINKTGQPLTIVDGSQTLDAGGRSFAVEPQQVLADEAGRVVLPPTTVTERSRPAAIAPEVEVGPVDEGGLIGTRRDLEANDAAGGSRGASAAPTPGFRWPAGSLARLRLIYRVGNTPQELTHEWTIRRTR